MKNKFLIFGGFALVIGAGAYIWYRKSISTTKNNSSKVDMTDQQNAWAKKGADYAKELASYKDNLLALGVSTNQLALVDSHKYTSEAESWKTVDWKTNNLYEA